MLVIPPGILCDEFSILSITFFVFGDAFLTQLACLLKCLYV
jgi:hypothetical protein